MKRTYSCPHCDVTLNPSVKIILSGEREGKRGLFLFSPKPGNYDVILPPELELKNGDEVSFACPACGKDLTSPKGKEWAEIAFGTPSTTGGTVVFSKVFGRHATYFITREEVRWYGEDAGESVNFWGAGPERES
jgi:hypothetical protein